MVNGACADRSLDRLDARSAPSSIETGTSAFERIYAAEFNYVHGLVARFGVAPSELEDLTQQVFGVALHKRDDLSALENPRAWLTAVVVRVVHEHYRWRRVRRLRAWLVEHSWAARGIEERTPEAELSSAESARHVRNILGRMSKKLRDALVLTELEGLEPRAAALLLGIPYNTLRSRQRLARVEFERLWRIAFGPEELER